MCSGKEKLRREEKKVQQEIYFDSKTRLSDFSIAAILFLFWKLFI